MKLYVQCTLYIGIRIVIAIWNTLLSECVNAQNHRLFKVELDSLILNRLAMIVYEDTLFCGLVTAKN